MSKTITTALNNHLQEESTTLCTLWRIMRNDGKLLYLTDHDESVVFQGNTYAAVTGFDRSAIETQSSTAVNNLDIRGLTGAGLITTDEIRAGLWDFAQVYLYIVNWANPAMGALQMLKGTFGNVLVKRGEFTAELRGLNQYLDQTVVELYQTECRADFGDHRCKFPVVPPIRQNTTAYTLGTFIRVLVDSSLTTSAKYGGRVFECVKAGTTASSAPTYNQTIGSTTTDGTAQFKAFLSPSSLSQVVSMVDRTTLVLAPPTVGAAFGADGFFNLGVLSFETGQNTGQSFEIREWTAASRTVKIFLPIGFDASAGDTVLLQPGCDKRSETCISSQRLAGSVNFTNGNIKNFRGEPFIPTKR